MFVALHAYAIIGVDNVLPFIYYGVVRIPVYF